MRGVGDVSSTLVMEASEWGEWVDPSLLTFKACLIKTLIYTLDGFGF